MYFYRMNLYFFGFEKSEFRTVMTTQTGAESVESLHKRMAIKQTVVNVFWVRFHKCAASFLKTSLHPCNSAVAVTGMAGGKTHPESVAINEIDSRTLAKCVVVVVVKFFNGRPEKGASLVCYAIFSRTKC